MKHPLINLFIAAIAAASLNVNAATVKLTGVANAQVRDGAYAGFYALEVDGNKLLGMCDDFSTNSTVGDTWSAIVYDGAQVSAGAGKFGPDPTRYSQIGYLFSLTGAADYSHQASINEAIWKIMTPGASALATLTGDALNYYNSARDGSHNTFDYSPYMMVVTPQPLNRSQEFLIVPGVVPPSSVPVPGAFWLLFSGAVGLFGIGRRATSA